MKKVLTYLSILLSVLCGSIFLVSCSKGYDDMYLTVECFENGEWLEIDTSKPKDYYLSADVYDENSDSYLLYLRVKVNCTSKTVNSLFISRSANNSVILGTDTVKPGEAFKVSIKNIGSVNFTVVPSNGGDDKSISFGVNIYRKLEGVSQNKKCVPALVTGGNIEIEKLTNLIKYEPFDDITGKSATNQTGVNYELVEVGTLVDEDNGKGALIKRNFSKYNGYTLQDDKIVKDGLELITLREIGGVLTLQVNSSYQLTQSNNVIRLKATSVYDENITSDVYVYIVENFTPDLYLVSYNDDVSLDADGKIQKVNAIDDEITIYNSSLQLQQNFGTVKVFSYTSQSIYSFISQPGLRLKLYIDGVPYDYNDYQGNSNLGITVSPVKCSGDKNYGLGLQFTVNSQQISSKSEYKIRLELDFTAFDFTASDKSPATILTKEFTLKIGSLASSFSINGRNYNENLNGEPQYVTEVNSNDIAKLYSYYNQDVLGLPLNILAVPTNAQNSAVKVGFYQDYIIEDGKVRGTALNNVQLSVAQSIGISPNAEGLFELIGDKTVYLKFTNTNISSNYLYMVCSAISTPDKFMGDDVGQKEIYFIAKFDILGAVKDLYVYKNDTDNLDADTLVDEYLENGQSNVAYIRIASGTGFVDVDLSKVYIRPYNIVPNVKKNVLLSANGTDWTSSELTMDKLERFTGAGRTYDTYKLYFKTTNETKGEGFTITSPNGVQKSLTYQFVNVTSKQENVNVGFDKTYIWQSETSEDVKVYDKDAKLNFLALQSNTTVKFEASGDGKNYNIKSLTVQSLTENSDAYNNIKKGEDKYYQNPISTFNSRAVVVGNVSSYFFDVRANSSGFTSIVLVEVKFYIKDNGIIKEGGKYFVYEIAVYIPATTLSVDVDKDSIIYVNDNYKDVARVRFAVSTNSATRQIYFSSKSVNESINVNYGEVDNNRIFGVQVSRADAVSDEYFNVVGLNSFGEGVNAKNFVGYSNNQFTIEAIKSLEGLKKDYGSIYFDFTIYQFGEPTTRTIRKVVYLGDYTKSERIIVDGVDIYNNLYLSFQSEEQRSATILASISNADATYKDLGYRLYTLNPSTKELTAYVGENLEVVYESNRFTITAKGNVGGTYQLMLYAKDSYDANINDYATKYSVVINVSNGTASNPYLVRTLKEFEYIANNLSSHYRLANDINLSSLSDENWWSKDRVFAGSLDGAMTVYDANNNIYVQKQYVLRELKIASVQGISDAYFASLFTSNTGIIKNIMLDSVKFDLMLTEGNIGDNPVNISALAGVNNGVIENCCVNIVSSSIIIGEGAGSTSYNIGVLVGTNNQTITYDNSQTATNYASMVGCNSSGILNIVVERSNSRNNLITNIGGMVGKNSGTISATYIDGSSQALKYLLTGVVNINVKTGVGENLGDMPELVDARVGGAVGLNTGTISKIAISGCIKANDKVDMGGIVGLNEGNILECANYGMVLEGYALSTYAPTDAKTVYTEVSKDENNFLLEQNIGGIVGSNSGKVDNVRILFITFENDEVSISAKEAYIKGLGNVAGVIGKASNTQLTRSYVENFIEDENIYNIIGIANANVAGLIATGTGNSINVALFKANIDARDCSVYEFGNGVNCEYVYFIGDILVNSEQLNDDKSLKNHNSSSPNVYIVENVIYYNDEKVQVKTSLVYGVEGIAVSGEQEIAGYTVRWVEDTDLINDGYPYLIYKLDGVEYYTLTVKPSEVVVNVDEDYFDNGEHRKEEKFEKYDQGLYVQYNGGENSTAVVYLYNGEDNIHRLVTEGDRKGLIERTIIPNVAKGEYTVRIISGVDVAQLISGDNSIKFNKTGKVVLQFTSIYDRKISDTVEIFVENALNENVFDISANENQISHISNREYSMRADTNALIGLNVNSVRANAFDKTKLYMKANVDKVKDANGTEITENINDYFSLTANSTSQSGGYAVGNYDFVAKALGANVEKIQVTITFQIYLDLSTFVLNSGKSLSEVTSNLDTLIAEKSITITIYNSAKSIRMSSDVSVSSGVSANIEINLETGYVDINDNNVKIPTISFSGDTLNPDVTGKDTIYAVLKATNQNAGDLVEYAKSVSDNKENFSIWDLFDTTLTYVREDSGYLYTINLMLKDEYKSLDKSGKQEGNWTFKLTAYAKGNSKVEGSVNIEFVPQQLDTFRLENYSKLVVKLGSDNASVNAEYVSNESASSLIIPGSSGLIKIYAEKSFAYCENIKISSSVVQVDGQEYFVRFQQMTYNRIKNVYESYAGITADGTSLNLVKVSYKENGKEEYSGVIFVRTILEKIVGTKQIFDISVSATTYNSYGNPVEVNTGLALISQYQPGVYLTVENALKQIKDNEELFMIEQNSNNVKIVAKVYSGDLNILPEWEIDWVTDGLAEEQKNSLGEPTNYIALREESVEIGADEAYYVTYTLRIDDTCKYPFKITFKVTLVDDGNRLTSDLQQVKFYPVPYIIRGMSIDRVSNGVMSINIGASRTIKLNWNSNSNAINEQIKATLGSDFLKLMYIQKTNPSGNVENVYFDKLTKVNDKSQNFVIENNEDGTYRITALNKGLVRVYFDLYYGYVFADGAYSVVFSTVATSDARERIHYEFNLELATVSTEDMPKPIYDAEDLRSMSAGENYILFEDIVLENWTPLTTAISSLDGNGKVITIKSFDIAVNGTVNAGLFAQINEGTIIKNVVINIAEYSSLAISIKDDNVSTANINFGFLAGINNGLVYNCEVLSIRTAKSIEIVIGSGYNLVFGGLVGENNGNITNSRVGTEYFEKISCTNTGIVSTTKQTCGTISIKSSGIMAGFIGVNGSSSIVSGCYVANTSIENAQNKGSVSVNKTAGFVAENNGLVAYSYVKGLESSILITKARATGARIYASGAGSVAGFVFVNSGTIHDCYSNIICESNSAVASGFVYDATSGSISQCYSASTVLSNNNDSALATELPFVGIGLDKNGAQQLLSSEQMQDCYYLIDGQDYDTNYIIPEGAYLPKGISLENFANSAYLNNFAFAENGSSEQQLNGGWTYSTAVDSNKTTFNLGVTNLPELTSANAVSRSIRYEPAQNGNINIDDLHDYPYAVGYDRGSKNNPYIIRSADEYKAIFNDRTTLSGYIRFIDNIDFAGENDSYMDISTRSNFVLGDKNENNLTVIDGNGVTIQNVLVNRTESDAGSIGLFAEAYYAVMKALNIEYAPTKIQGTSQATYSGGFVGKANNVFFIDIKLTGNEIRANNIAGGLVGKLTGQRSGIYNVTSDLAVIVGLGQTNQSYLINDDTNLSYAGGLAGIIEIGNSKDNISINRVTINSSNVTGNKVGGIAGYMGSKVYANRLTYNISANSQISGKEIAGGVVGENYARISLSQVGMPINTQYTYDKAFGEYINSTENEFNASSYGNLNAVVGNEIVGGFVGLNNGGEINDSLTKANIGRIKNNIEPSTIGGFVGKTLGGVYKTCYAQNYIDLTFTSNLKYVGGFAGEIQRANNLTIDNCVVANWFDKARLIEIKDLNNKPEIDYVAGKSDGGNANLAIYYGDYLDAELSLKNILQKPQHFDMKALYNLEASNQKEIFETLFILWDTNYWDLDNTRFMPNLKQDNATSFIELRNQEDLKKFNLYPNSNFILMNDISVGELDSNYVANIDFTGILIGRIQEDGSYPAFKEITLKANTSRSVTSGFFRSTSKARVANVRFVYSAINLDGDVFANVGGVSAEDQNSRFESLEVSGQINTITSTVISVGSVTGTGKRSTIVGCQSTMEYKFTLGDTQASIGGIVGNVDGSNIGTEIGEDVNTFDALIRNSSYKGRIATKYTGDKIVYSSIGGIVGVATYTNITNCEVELKDGNDKDLDGNDLQINNNAYVGGIAGSVYPATIQSCSVDIMPVCATENENINLSLGGIIGKTNTNGVNVNDSNAKVSVVFKQTVPSMVLGGIIAEISGTSTEKSVSINRVYAETNIDLQEDVEIANAVVGGIVGISGSVEINSSIAYLNPCSISYETYLVGGGMIGEAQGDYAINHSLSTGRLLANSTKNDTTTTTILGGMIGLVGKIDAEVTITPNTTVKGRIVDSYTTVTLSTSGIYQGTVVDDDPTKSISHSVYANAVVGYSKAEKIEISNVVYSSDYCLAFDNDIDKYTTLPINYSANILINVGELKQTEENKQLNDLFKSNWRLESGYLPVQVELQDLLVKAGVLIENDGVVEYSDLIQGQSYNPIQLTQDDAVNLINDNKDKYCYYILLDDMVMADSIETLNGVILGCNFKVEGAKTFVIEITKHSAISNIVYTISSDATISGGGIAQTNNGTISMCGVEYNNMQFNGQFGGIAQTNNGNVMYCYNSGSVKSASGTGAGLVCNNNQFASIQYSYFIGMLANENLSMSAICYSNAGYIANCYSAGAAGSAITTIDTDGRYEDNFFDYYANFMKKEVYDNEYSKIAIGKSTVEMQQSNDGYSTLWNNHDWLVYSILNVEFSGQVQANTYNYGYPIHNFNQKVLIGGVIVDIPMRAKLTGNGTFKDVDNEEAVVGRTVKDKNNGVYDDNSYLLSHYGMLVMVSSMESTESRYFELEYDIIIPDDITEVEYLGDMNWQGIGSGREAFAGVFSSIYPLDNGKTYYELDEDFADEHIIPEVLNRVRIVKSKDAESKRKITGLAGDGLFRVLADGAVVANITLNNSQANVAPLANYVGKADEDSSNSYIVAYNVGISGELKSLGNISISGLADEVRKGYTFIVNKLSIEGGNYQIYSTKGNAITMNGLFNLNKGNIKLYDFDANKITFKYDGDSKPTISGIVRENKDTGVISILGRGSVAPLGITVNSNNVESMSGVAGINSGTITGENMTVEFNEITKEGKSCDTIAGAVGVMKGGLIAGFSLQFQSSDPKSYIAKSFGGVVAKMIGGRIGVKGNGTEQPDLPISVGLPCVITDTFGGVICELSKGDEDDIPQECSIENVVVETSTSILQVQPIDENGNGVAYGLIVGVMNNVLADINYKCDKIDFEVINGINVGGFAGLSSVEVYNFSNEAQILGSIKGVGNVGGFIGQYIYDGTGPLQFNGNAWVVNSQAEYATIGVYCAEDSTAEKDRSNFGGIFGWWNSGAELSAKLVEGEDTENDLKIENSNKVLVDELENFTYGSSVKISNVGGVVGLSRASIKNVSNKGEIGVAVEDVEVNDNGGFSPLTQENIQKMPNLVCVGGIVGSISEINKDVVNVTNSASIYGLNCVGGIVGYAKSIGSLGGSTNEAGGEDNGEGGDGVIVGLMNVGGVAGFIETQSGRGSSSRGSISNFDINVNVIGVVNVGGMVGKATNVKINDSTIKSKKIKGNMNVGGVAGMLTNSSVGDVTEVIEVGEIENVRTLQANTVYGTIYEVIVPVEKNSQTYEKSINFLPTNIGGVVGNMVNSGSTNTKSYMRVETDNLYKTKVNITDTKNRGKLTVSLNENYIGKLSAVASQNDTSLSKYYPITVKTGGEYSAEATSSNAVDGGIGGFAGFISMSSATAFGFPTSQTFGDVYAEFGINVGGVAGYVQLPTDNGTTVAVTLPSLPTDKTYAVNVAGNTFVGGYVGKIHSIQSEKFFEKNDIGYVNVQKYIAKDPLTRVEVQGVATGNCIGGVFGYCQHSLTGIELVSKGNESGIKIFNKADSSFGTSYVGGIVGRIDGELTDCSIDQISCGAVKFEIEYDYDLKLIKCPVYDRLKTDSDTEQDSNYAVIMDADTEKREIIQSYGTFNYGGLAGMVRIPNGTSSSNPFKVNGVHYYPFTVDSVQSEDFAQGATQYSYGAETENNTLSAIAHYVNLSNISISSSSLTALYDKESAYWQDSNFSSKVKGYQFTSDETTKSNADDTTYTGGNRNPMVEDSNGWAKEYTMFRMWDRVISQPGETTGDSIQTIFNAQYITGVCTDYDTVESESLVENTVMTYSNNIIYTIYEPINQSPMLYCKYGIAKLDLNFDPYIWTDYSVEKNDAQAFEKNYEVTLVRDSIETSAGTSYGNSKIWKSNFYVDGKLKTGYGRNAFWKHIRYARQLGVNPEGSGLNENGLIDERINKACVDNSNKYQYTFGYSYYKTAYRDVGGAYFKFVTVYSNIGAEYSQDELSNSGSLFEASGVAHTVQLGNIEPKLSFWQKVKKFFWGAVKWIGSVGKFVGKITGPVGKLYTAASEELIRIANLGINKYQDILNRTGKAVSFGEDEFGYIEDASYGYLGPIYNRDIRWKGDDLVSDGDAVLQVAVRAKLLTPDISTKTFNDMTEEGKKEIVKKIFNVSKDDVTDGMVNYVGHMIDLVVNELKTSTLPVYAAYKYCQNTNILPSDLDDVCIVDIDSDSTDSQSLVLSLFGIRQYTIPKYIKGDNELYVYAGDQASKSKNLYQNYDSANKDHLNNIKFVDGVDYVDNGGYLYISKESKENGVQFLPVEHEEYLQETYGISRRIVKPLRYSIALGKGDDTVRKKKVKEGELSLQVVDNNATGDLIVTRPFYFAGYSPEQLTNVDLTNCVEFESWVDDTGGAGNMKIVYMKRGEQYYKVNSRTHEAIVCDPVDEDKLESYKYMRSTYFTIDKNENYVGDLWETYVGLQLQITKSSSGIPLGKAGIDYNNYHYKLDPNGQIAFNVDFYYCNLNEKWEGSNGSGTVWKTIPDSVNEKIKVYSYKKVDADGNYKFSDAIEITYDDLRVLGSDDSPGWNKYKGYSLSNSSYILVSSVFNRSSKGYLQVADNVISYKKEYVVQQDEKGNDIMQEYFYKEINESKSIDDVKYYYYNKYVYENGKKKLYTRYKYENSNTAFLETEVDKIIYDTDKGYTQTETVKLKLKDILYINQDPDLIFIECVRVSFSVGGESKIKGAGTGQIGSIKCELPSFMQPNNTEEV